VRALRILCQHLSLRGWQPFLLSLLLLLLPPLPAPVLHVAACLESSVNSVAHIFLTCLSLAPVYREQGQQASGPCCATARHAAPDPLLATKDAGADGSATAVPGPTYACPAAAAPGCPGHCRCGCGVHCDAYSTFPFPKGAVCFKWQTIGARDRLPFEADSSRSCMFWPEASVCFLERLLRSQHRLGRELQ
jgi:hypothetical protein